MRRYHRHRPAYTTRRRHSTTGPMLGMLVVVTCMLLAGWWLIRTFGFGNTVQRVAANMQPEQNAVVQVSIGGGEWNRTSQSLKLYADDGLATGSNTHAMLDFFDSTVVRLDSNTTVRIVESNEGEKESAVTIGLEDGIVWVHTPATSAFTGSIVRTVRTPLFRAELSGGTEALVTPRSVIVFRGEGIGTAVHVSETEEPIFIGEGQMLHLPADVQTHDLYRYRSTIDTQTADAPFVQASRTAVRTALQNRKEATLQPSLLQDGEVLQVTEPKNNARVQGQTVTVRGSVDTSTVATVRINGYETQFDAETGVFSLELSLPIDNDITDISIDAMGTDGALVYQIVRTVESYKEPPEPPTFIRPAETGATYQTQNTRIEIVGRAPEDAVGIIVNDYRLQFFEPGDATWTYLASTILENLVEGENVYEAVAVNEAGLLSEPATLTIILGGETEGIITPGENETEEEEEEEEELQPAQLPQNDPLMPGSITVTAPTPGSEHEADTREEASLLIEGTVPAATHTVWVNGYRLRLYEPGKTYWNYIASTELGTMSRGRNGYEIVARNAEGQILDTFTYIIRFSPKG